MNIATSSWSSLPKPSSHGHEFPHGLWSGQNRPHKGTERDSNRTATHCPRVVLLKPDFGTVTVADSDTNQLRNPAQGMRAKHTPARKMDAHMMSETFSNAGRLSWAICYD